MAERFRHDQSITDIMAKDLSTIESGSNIRRVPVLDNGSPVGIVSLGDLALALDEESALADISSAGQNN